MNIVSAVRLLIAFLFALQMALHAANAPAGRPNVLLIITDDQGYGDFSLHGNPHLQTPHIDKLAASGVQSERFFVNSFCAPTRAALLTGRWRLRTGCHGVTHNCETVRPSEATLAEALQGEGYGSACIGKWHNGEQFPFTPQGQGFDDSPLKFANGPGFANDWLTGWTDTKAKVWFEIEVVAAGEYELELAYACPDDDAGSKLRISVGDQSLEASLLAAEAPEIPLPHRDPDGQSRYRDRVWSTLKLGTLRLPQGPARLTLEPLTMPRGQVMDLKHVKLTRYQP